MTLEDHMKAITAAPDEAARDEAAYQAAMLLRSMARQGEPFPNSAPPQLRSLYEKWWRLARKYA